MGNERYKIKIEAPLIRPGVTIETEVSQRYVVKTLALMMDMVREFNDKGKREMQVQNVYGEWLDCDNEKGK